MRILVSMAALGALAGCATAPPPRVVARPIHRAAQPAKPHADHPTPAPVKLDAPTPAPEGPGANIPLEGFRPMRRQSGNGA